MTEGSFLSVLPASQYWYTCLTFPSSAETLKSFKRCMLSPCVGWGRVSFQPPYSFSGFSENHLNLLPKGLEPWKHLPPGQTGTPHSKTAAMKRYCVLPTGLTDGSWGKAPGSSGFGGDLLGVLLWLRRARAERCCQKRLRWAVSLDCRWRSSFR